ncbi:hypothetical protein [Nocardia sp. NPDC004722]
MSDADASSVRQALYEMVDAYLLGDADWVKVVSDGVGRTGCVEAVLAEANRWGEYLSGCADVSDDPVSPEFIGAGIRARLAAVLPRDEELAAVAAVDCFSTPGEYGGWPSCATAVDRMLLLHVMAAGIVELGLRAWGSGFSAEMMESTAEMDPRLEPHSDVTIRQFL